eukprot:SAG22_NODE_4483_length_1255_cov_2.861592_1_plen_105_part_10
MPAMDTRWTRDGGAGGPPDPLTTGPVSRQAAADEEQQSVGGLVHGLAITDSSFKAFPPENALHHASGTNLPPAAPGPLANHRALQGTTCDITTGTQNVNEACCVS